MSMIALLFYCLVLIFVLHRMIRNREVSLSVWEIGLAFLFKVGLACLYGYVFLHYYNGDDTWDLHARSLEERDKLLNTPGHFFYNFTFSEAYEWEGRRFWPALQTWYTNLEKYSLPKTLALINFVSGGNYYINTVFFSFIVFWGHYWLFSLFVNTFPGKRFLLLLVIFFFPPVVFWLSGIRADGLLLFFLGLLLLFFNRWLQEPKKKHLILWLLALSGIFVFRSALLLILAPALVAWFIAVRRHQNALATFAWVYGICLVIFFTSAWLSPVVNVPQIIVQRQQQFMALHGTRFQLDSLQPSVSSFARVLPQAAGNTFLRPFLWEADGLLQVMTALEVMVFWLLILTAAIKRDGRWRELITMPLTLFCLFFGVSLYLFIGYSVPFPGAIVRYKTLGELVLLTVPVIIFQMDFPRSRLTKKYIFKKIAFLQLFSGLIGVSRSIFLDFIKKTGP